MDPSIMKLLEEDEDESMHSGADVDAFQAALNRDIGGDTSTSLPHASGWQSTMTDENPNHQAQQDQGDAHHREQLLSEMEQKQHGDPPQNIAPEANHQLLHQKQSQDENQQRLSERIPHQIPQMTGMHVSEKTSIPMSGSDRTHAPESEPQYLKLQKMSNQQAMASDQANNRPNRLKQVPFALLLPVILPQLDKDRAMQLQTLYVKLKKNEIPKEGFVRIMRGIVGDQMLKLAVTKMQQAGPHQFHMQGEASALQNHPRMQSAPPAKFSESTGQDRENSSAPIQGLNKQQQQQQHPQNIQTSFPMYGSGGSYHPFGGTNVSGSASSIKSQPHDFQMKQMSNHQNMGPSQTGGIGQAMSAPGGPKFERPNSINDPKRMQSGSYSPFTNNVPSPQGSTPWKSSINKDQTSGPFSSSSYESTDQSAGQTEPKFPLSGTSKDNSLEPQSPGMSFLNAASTGSSLAESLPIASSEDPNVQVGSRLTTSPGGNSRTPSKKPSIGQKKPLESLGSSPPSSKKQKVSGAFADQSIEQLIDVTAVSGVNLREEEEQLFSGPKEDSRASEASRRVVQEEEEALILQRAPLQKKIAEIMSKCGVKNIGNDVERCLSLCVEERMRGLLCNLIRLSKQRVDTEKSRHRTIITSDVRHQLTILNRKAREEWEKKQADAEKLRKLSEPEGSNAADGDKEKNEGRGKVVKANKEEDDKMRTTAANVAARAAVGGDDMLSKWQLMAEQARQKREGGNEGASGSQHSKDSNRKSTSASGRSGKELQESGKRGQSASAGVMRKFRRSHGVPSQPRIARTISIKDMIAVLEREPQMSKSSLIYRLYDKVHSDTAAD
ncbi:transcription initiation factor TFIID subunit 4b isoform X2 [Punica granatum]|uniref:Transcription initiation factor TFIID subunit 4b isoform X2 n=1 Tax=Punica granatum TaxID=22663 RepID=A0A6P8DYL2_PUNGR|nr:transcription initiation factor TFIID subunit 4b isoform X2 [Punica granatum]